MQDRAKKINVVLPGNSRHKYVGKYARTNLVVSDGLKCVSDVISKNIENKREKFVEDTLCLPKAYKNNQINNAGLVLSRKNPVDDHKTQC